MGGGLLLLGEEISHRTDGCTIYITRHAGAG